MQELHAFVWHSFSEWFMQENRKIDHSVHKKTHITFPVDVIVVGIQEKLEELGWQLHEHRNIGDVEVEIFAWGSTQAGAN